MSIPLTFFFPTEHMKHLTKLIGTFKRLANRSRFVFVPGADDPTPSSELFVKYSTLWPALSTV